MFVEAGVPSAGLAANEDIAAATSKTGSNDFFMTEL